jgi:tetratricopeptide (TPR) repeat protein
MKKTESNRKVNLLRELKKNPHDSKLRAQTAIGLWRAGKETEAIATLNDGLRLKSQDVNLAHCLGMLYAEKEQFELSQEWLHQALQWDDQHVESCYYLGLTYAAQHKFDSAFPHFQKAAQLRPGDKTIKEALNLTGQCMQKRVVSTPHQSFPLLERVSERPAHTAADQLTDMILEETDYIPTLLNDTTHPTSRAELQLLLDALDRAIHRYPDHADLLYHRGVVLDRLDQIIPAIRSVRESLRINEQYKEALMFLGTLYQKVYRHEKAIQAFGSAIEAGAAYADVYLLLGQSYQQTGQTDSARIAYEKALLINDQYRAAKEALAALAA